MTCMHCLLVLSVFPCTTADKQEHAAASKTASTANNKLLKTQPEGLPSSGKRVVCSLNLVKV